MKITLPLDSFDDYEVIAHATGHYFKNLKQVSMFLSSSQQRIHLSILTSFRYDLMKKMMSQSPPKKPNLKLDEHTAFVLYDAFRNYATACSENLEAAKLRRLNMELFSQLPHTTDMENLSLMSTL